MAEQHIGRIVTRFGSEMLIEDQQGHLHRATARRKLQHATCGDQVRWQESDIGNVIVTAIEKRRNALERCDSFGKTKTIAANIDQLVIVVARAPAPSLEMVDRYLIAAEKLDCAITIFINKADLDDLAKLDEIRRLEDLGYNIVEGSAANDFGLEHLRALLADKVSIFVGQSGVGKSSLINALLPDLELRVGELSQASGEGTHTTTTASLYHLPESGGSLIDSPGVRDFSLNQPDQKSLEQGFAEFRPFLGQCQFNNCTHSHEPNCAVRQALADGKIDPRRYQSYLKLLKSLSEAN